MIGRALTAAKWIALGFGHKGLVLDLGSGNSPHPRADVLCDRHLTPTGHRHAKLVKDRSLVCADISALPFRDKVFSFVICRMVLEHIDPAQLPSALLELSRVASAGYIETPSPICELLMPDPCHTTFVELDADTLVFTPKAQSVPFPAVAYTLGRWRRELKVWQQFISNHQSLLSVRLSWTGSIAYRISTPASVPSSFSADTSDVLELFNNDDASFVDRSLRSVLKALVRRAFHAGGPRIHFRQSTSSTVRSDS